MGLYQTLERCCLSTSIVTIHVYFRNPLIFAGASGRSPLHNTNKDFLKAFVFLVFYE